MRQTTNLDGGGYYQALRAYFTRTALRDGMLEAMLVALIWLWGCGRSQCSDSISSEHTRRRFARFAYVYLL